MESANSIRNFEQDASFPGPQMSFEEVQHLVEAGSPVVCLLCSGESQAADSSTPTTAASSSSSGNSARHGKGRYLIARRAISSGETILSEYPLFRGTSSGTQSRKVFIEEFANLIDTMENADLDTTEDIVHPCDPEVDCLAGIALCRKEVLHGETEAQRARAKLRLRKLVALQQRVCTLEEQQAQDDCIRIVHSKLLPEMRDLISESELHGYLRILGCNRFSNELDDLDLMFVGSMFEHSCTPNCFAAEWSKADDAKSYTRVYRAQRDIEEGEALSIDYLMLPDGYAPYSKRAQLLEGWGFKCSCQRCTVLPDLTRSFVCPMCHAHELCPRMPDNNAEWFCQNCGSVPKDSYKERCIACEEKLHSMREKDVSLRSVVDDTEVIGSFHYEAFLNAWTCFSAGPSACGSLDVFETATESLICAIQRLYQNPQHPQLRDLYHTMAQIKQNDIELQKYYLEQEDAVMKRNYPEEAAKLESEITMLVQGGPWSQFSSSCTRENLGTMD